MTGTTTEGPGVWLAARLAAGKPAETWKPVAKIDGCTFSAYEASDQGRRRRLDGDPFSNRPGSGGYVRAKLSCDNPGHGPHTITMQKIVLTTFDRPRPRGMEACHSKAGPQFNWWPEGVRWDTKPANEAEKDEPPTPPEPSFPCKNAPACPNLVVNEGRRCLDCVTEVGRQAAAMLNAGVVLFDVREHFGYKGDKWVFDLAVRYGGYAGSIEDARGPVCKACNRPAGREAGPWCIDDQREQTPRPWWRRVTARRKKTA